VQPKDAAITADQGGTGELEDVAVLLEGAFQADAAARGFGIRATLAEASSGQKDFPPGAALQSHGAIALAGRIRDANLLDAVPATEACGLFRRALHNTAHANPAFLELGERLAQLHEGMGIKRSTEMTQPENQRRPRRPEFRKPLGLTGRQRVTELGGGVADFVKLRHKLGERPAWLGVYTDAAIFPLCFYKRHGSLL